MKIYQPPYTITPEILKFVAAISEAVGRRSSYEQYRKNCP